MNTPWKRKTTLFLLSQTVSLFGSMLVQYAITWHITLTTQSGAMMTIAVMCSLLPTLVLSPFAGVWADRYNRKTLIVLADAGIALATLALAVLFLTGHDALWMLFAAMVVRAFGTAVQTPAVGAMLPQLVPAERLTWMNATYSSIQSVVAMASPMLSGVLLTLAGIETVFFVDVVTAAIAIFVLLALLEVPSHAKAQAKQALTYFEDMRQGFAYIRAHALVKTYCLFSAISSCLQLPPCACRPSRSRALSAMMCGV